MSQNKLDIAFCVDNTGSMSTYIHQVQQNIANIVKTIIASEKADVKFGLVRYRDFTDDFVTQVHPFTDSLKTMQSYVDVMSAQGGGDGPEAVASGLHALLSLDWRKEATKIAIFVADAPPHGLEPSGDSYPNGGPDNIDPFQAIRELVKNEIIIYSVGCEPVINSYKCARDYMKSVADQSGGKYISLAQAHILADVIIGGAREEMNLEKIADEIAKETETVKKTGSYATDEAMYAAVTANLQARGVTTPKMHVNEVGPASAFHFASAYSNSTNLAEAKAAQTSLGLPPSSGGDFSTPTPRASSFRAPTSAVFGAPPTMAPMPSMAYAAPPMASPMAPPQAQQANFNTSSISMEQVQRVMQRKTTQQQYQSHS